LFDVNHQDKIRRICEEVQSLTGIQLGPQKHEMVQGRLSRRLRELRLETLDQYMTLLERDPSEKTSLIDILTTNKTSFFREARHFEVLERHLLQTVKAGGEPTVWSAGCSSGEEPYTMAIVARRASIPARILATDISSRVLDTARWGRYPRESVGDLPDRSTREALARRYYELLAPGGLLFVGLSESLNGLDHRFDQVEPGAYRK
jgi:chemotaxis protein methyltransferase CheR